jgi:hypothetical protein
MTVPEGFVREALEVRRQIKASTSRMERHALPTPEALASKWGVSFTTAWRYMHGKLPKRLSEDA